MSVKFYKKTIFWENMKKTMAVFSGPAVLGLHEFGAADHYMIIAASLGFIGAIISVWMTDHDNNGTIDLFQ